MKLASLNQGRDGVLIVVSRDLSRAVQVPQIAAISINVPVDIPAVNSGDDESEEEAEARRRAEEENVQ